MKLKLFHEFNNKFLLINFRSPKIPDLFEILKSIGYNISMIDWDKVSQEDLKGLNGIILSGSFLNLSQEDSSTYTNKFSYLKNIQTPILGVCFGHQFIGVLFGSDVYRGEEIKKDETIKILKEDPLLNGFTYNIIMKQSHSEGINLPQEFDLLGTSDSCEVEIIKHKSKNIYGVQFHPELSGTPGEILLRNFYKICNQKNKLSSY